MGHSLPLFSIFVFSIVPLVEKILLIQTADLWCRKRPLNLLSPNHCPNQLIGVIQAASRYIYCYMEGKFHLKIQQP